MPTALDQHSDGKIEIEAIFVKPITMPESLPTIVNACESAIIYKLPLATIDYTSDPVRWGNSPGLSLLEHLDRHDAELQFLRKSLETTKISLDTTKMRITDLESEVS